MATIGIVSAVTEQPTPQSHPKAAFRAEDGTTMVLRWAPTGADLGGWGVTWAALDRPGRKAIVARTGEGLETLSFEFLLGDPDHQVDVEDELAELKRLAKGGQRITLVNLSPNEAGPWRIDDVKVAASLRQHGTNRITRAMVTISLVEASDANPTLGPRYRRKALTTAVRFTARAGMTPQSQAHKYYGDPALWPIITKYNRMTTARFRIGSRYTVPKYTP